MFGKKKKLKCLVDNKHIHELFPIVDAADFQPSWVANMANVYRRNKSAFDCVVSRAATVKSCYGITSLLSRGFVLRAWRDISLLIEPDGRVAYAGGGIQGHVEMDTHDPESYKGLFNGLTMIKLQNPWRIYGKGKFLMVPCQYHNDLSVRAVQPMGVVEFEVNHHANVFLGFKPQAEAYEVFIPAGYPLAQFVPLDDKYSGVDCEYSEKINNDNPPFFLHWHKRVCRLKG